MEGFHQVSGKRVHLKTASKKSTSGKRKSKVLSTVSGQKGYRLRFNTRASEEFNLDQYKYAEVYLSKDEVLLVPTNTKSATTFNINLDASLGTVIHAVPLFVKGNLDVLKIKKHKVIAKDGGIVFSRHNVEPEVEKAKQWEVRGTMTVIVDIYTSFTGDKSEARGYFNSEAYSIDRIDVGEHNCTLSMSSVEEIK